MQPITPFLWFNDNAEEAVSFYVSLLPNSRIIEPAHCNDARPGAAKVLTIKFQLEGVAFVALNGGPHYTFTPAVSLALYRDTQPEIDHLWEALLEGGGKPSRCGWLQDKFGLSWQVVPTALPKLLQQKDPVKAKRVMDAMMKMAKLDIAELEQAANAD